MSWKFQSASSAFEQYRSTWDRINQARDNHILLDSGFVAPLLKHFPDESVLLGTSGDLHEEGVALLTPRGLGRWETFQPSQAPIGLLLFSQHDPTGASLNRMLGNLPGYALELSVLQQDPDYPSIPWGEGRPGFERLEYIQTARITMTGSFEEYWKQRGSNLRHNLARRRRRMAEKNFKAELITRRSPGEVQNAICEYGRLESTGWKGENGTAVAVDNAQGQFYRQVFEHFCERGEGLMYQYTFNGKVVASDLCLMRGAMMIVLKTAYDESMNEYSPALMMREDQMKQLFAENRVRVIEFYGRVMDWHRRWTEEIRTLYHVNCWRHPWMAPLKKLLSRSK